MPQLVDIVGGLKMTQDAVNERLADLKHKHDNDQYYFQAVIENAKTERDKLERCMSAAYEDKLDSVSLLEQYDGASKTLQGRDGRPGQRILAQIIRLRPCFIQKL